MNCKTFL